MRNLGSGPSNFPTPAPGSMMGIAAMTTTLAVAPTFRPRLAAALLGAALLLGSAPSGHAADMQPIPVSAGMSQAQDSSQNQPVPAPVATKPAPVPLPPFGTVGFGWG